MLDCKHQWHCACSSQICTYIIKDAGRQAAHKKQRKYTFYIHVLKVNINFQRNKNFQFFFTKLNDRIPLNCTRVMAMVFYHHFQQYCSYLVSFSFIGGGNPSIRRKPPTCRKSFINFITKCCIEYTSP